MYVSEKFIFTELHKTAGTHLGKWLKVLAPGEQVGKHNRVPTELRNRVMLGSIRNPWDWYVSLWAYGCDGKGSVYHQTCDGVNFRYYREQLTREMGRKYLSVPILFRQLIADRKKPITLWQQSYNDSTSAQDFKSWLKLMFNGERRLDMREGFGFSPVANTAGLMTYRFLKLFTDLDSQLYSQKFWQQQKDIHSVWSEHRIADFFIRMENLEDDLIQAMELAQVDISEQNRTALVESRNKKTNTSSRLPASHYYDEESIEWISQREKTIIDLFDYQPPQLNG